MRNRFKSSFAARLLSCIMAFSLVLGFGAPAVMAEEAAVTTAAPLTDYEPSYEYIEAENFLTALGISNNAPEDITENVTRGQFVDMYVRALNLGKIDKDVRAFADVMRSHPYYESITTAYNVGLVSGVRDGYFEPDTEILYEHTKALALKALGVTDTTINHYHFVKALNVPRNGNGITYENAIVLIYNMLKSNVIDITYASDETSFTYNKDTTLFNYIWQAYEVKGVVTSTEVASLGRTTACPEGQIEIDHTNYLTDLKNTYDFLGYNCIAIVSHKDSDTPKVISLAKKTDERILELNSLNLKKNCYDGTKIKYTDDNGKEHEVKVSPTSYVLYNGAFAGSQFEKSIFNFDLGEVTLIDTDEDRVYDVIKILEYKYLYASAIPSGSLMILQDQYNPNDYLQLTPESNDLILEIEIDGKPAEIGQIVQGDLVAYAKSPEGASVNYLSLKINREELTGQLTKISKNIWTINDRDMVASDFIRQAKVTKGDIPSMGVMGTYSLDFLGRLILFRSVATSDYNYGILLEVDNMESAFSSGVTAKFYTSGESIAIYEAPNGVRIDDLKYTSGDAARAYLSGTVFSIYDSNATLCQLVKYKVDENGHLHSIYTAYEGSNEGHNENAPHTSFPLEPRYFSTAQMYVFGNQVREYRATNSTIIFTIPPALQNGGVDENQFNIIRRDILESTFERNQRNTAGYDCGPTGEAKAIVFEHQFAGSAPPYPNYELVINKYLKTNSKGELAYQFELMKAGNTLIYETRALDELKSQLTAEDYALLEDIAVGDIIWYQLDNDNEIMYFDRCFNLDSPKILHGIIDGNTTQFSQNRITVGYLESFLDGFGYVTYDASKSTDTTVEAFRNLTHLGSTYFNVFYVNSGKAVAGNVIDLPNYVSRKKGEDILLVIAEQNAVSHYTFYIYE